MKITRELIEQLKTENGGWNRAELVWLGVELDRNRPVRGWKRKLEDQAAHGYPAETVGARPVRKQEQEQAKLL